MSKIAPRLSSLCSSTSLEMAGLPMAEIRSEFRALLAVARAVAEESDEVAALSRLARGANPWELDGDEIGRRLENMADRLGQKMARLSRAGRGRGKP